jgi:hypothetical protein
MDAVSDIKIALSGVVLIAICTCYHVKPAFVVALTLCSIVSWWNNDDFPESVTARPVAPYKGEDFINGSFDHNTKVLTFEMGFLYLVTLNGLARTFSDFAHVTKSDGSVPRGRWLYLITGGMTIFSGLFGGPPVLLSAENPAAIKAGARTGLSAVVAGIIFCIATFFGPLFTAVPEAGTAPLLISIGSVLFMNTKKIDWTHPPVSFPAYIVLFLIPFTYNLLNGVMLGWLAYLIIAIFSGEILLSIEYFVNYNSPKAHGILYAEQTVAEIDASKNNKFSLYWNRVQKVYQTVFKDEHVLTSIQTYLVHEILNADAEDHTTETGKVVGGSSQVPNEGVDGEMLEHDHNEHPPRNVRAFSNAPVPVRRESSYGASSSSHPCYSDNEDAVSDVDGDEVGLGMTRVLGLEMESRDSEEKGVSIGDDEKKGNISNSLNDASQV